MSPLRDQLLKVAHGYIDGFNQNTPEGVIAYRAPNCVHRIVPTSANIPARSNEEYQNFISSGFQIIKNFKLRISEGHEPVIDEVARKIVLFISSSADSPIGPYTNEYVFELKTNEDGTLIEQITEFIDTAPTVGFTQKMMAHLASLTGQASQ
ncbi:hypothetical protein S40285_10017 [Stachybotrys chlorohalonatus IBT 40285]|uniref:SnoaL-like domain-containing protein n=1 Tax=Stachybotrys chlorohalonatus (strain IBT 40285) TaxID=1283841 RepID=A0A084QVZ5_STAC4|nr:hypothetical protein S40285_10017 [Stachybotrys chlorohalonata IBT 40285]